ncbi:MAG: hypothetical protein JSR33_04000 [Proteobacteria bacterium]|nr:hypothetical protein [Pseudomonadota bacterium]
MKKSVVVNFFTLGIVFSTSALASIPIEDSVICPVLESVVCTNNGSTHFYSSKLGFPEGNWTSDFYQNSCPDKAPKVGIAIASTAEQNAEVVCAYHTEHEVIKIFQSSVPSYCVKYICSEYATTTPEGGCVKFNQIPCNTN